MTSRFALVDRTTDTDDRRDVQTYIRKKELALFALFILQNSHPRKLLYSLKLGLILLVKASAVLGKLCVAKSNQTDFSTVQFVLSLSK